MRDGRTVFSETKDVGKVENVSTAVTVSYEDKTVAPDVIIKNGICTAVFMMNEVNAGTDNEGTSVELLRVGKWNSDMASALISTMKSVERDLFQQFPMLALKQLLADGPPMDENGVRKPLEPNTFKDWFASLMEEIDDAIENNECDENDGCYDAADDPEDTAELRKALFGKDALGSRDDPDGDSE